MGKKRKEQGESSASVEAERKTPKVVIVSNGDDWMGLYIDGVLAFENHTIRVRDVLVALKIECDWVECDRGWIYNRGTLPRDLSEVVRPG